MQHLYDFPFIQKFNMEARANFAFWLAKISKILCETACACIIEFSLIEMFIIWPSKKVKLFLSIKNPRWTPLQNHVFTKDHMGIFFSLRNLIDPNSTSIITRWPTPQHKFNIGPMGKCFKSCSYLIPPQTIRQLNLLECFLDGLLPCFQNVWFFFVASIGNPRWSPLQGIVSI